MRHDCLRPHRLSPRPQPLYLLLALLAALSATACHRTDDGNAAPVRETTASPATASTLTPAQPASAPVPAAESDASITMRYTCEQGHSVAIAGGEARVTLADGRNVAIARVEGSAPPRFSGEALSFTVNDTGAVLGQDEVGGFDCTAD